MEIKYRLNMTTWQKTRWRNVFEKNMSANIKLEHTLLSKKAGLFMKIAVPLATNFLASLGRTTAVTTINAGSWKKKHGPEKKL